MTSLDRTGARNWSSTFEYLGDSTTLCYDGLSGPFDLTCSRGSTRASFWGIRLTPTPRTTTLITADGCSSFTTGQSGGPIIGYRNQPAISRATCNNATLGKVHYVLKVTAYLSDGSTLVEHMTSDSSAYCANES